MRDPLTACRHSDWSLLIGAFVEIRKHLQPPRSGFVDDAMADSSALWLAADGAHHRVLVEKAEGYEVWVDPCELERQLSYRMAFSALHGAPPEEDCDK
jgi:hypothetical protein